MAAVLADVPRVDSLTEQFGRQLLEDSLAHRTESLGSQLSAADNHVVDVRLASSRSAEWIICERPHTRSKPRNHANHRIKAQRVSCNLQHLDVRESPQLVSEVCIVKVVGNKRNLKRNQTVKPSMSHKKESAFDKHSTTCDERDEALDLSSSSDDELRELFESKAKPSEQDRALQGKSDGIDNYSAGKNGLARDHSDKIDARRKRYKTSRGSLKKKLKISRPCLDLEKMVERRLEDLKTDGKYPESIFHPIHHM